MEQGPKAKAQYTVEDAQRAGLTDEELKVTLLTGHIQSPAGEHRLEMRDTNAQVQVGSEVRTIGEIEREALKRVVPGVARPVPRGPSN